MFDMNANIPFVPYSVQYTQKLNKSREQLARCDENYGKPRYVQKFITINAKYGLDSREVNYYLKHGAVIKSYKYTFNERANISGYGKAYYEYMAAGNFSGSKSRNMIIMILLDRVPVGLPDYHSVPAELGGGYISLQPAYAASTVVRKTVTI